MRYLIGNSIVFLHFNCSTERFFPNILLSFHLWVSDCLLLLFFLFFCSYFVSRFSCHLLVCEETSVPCLTHIKIDSPINNWKFLVKTVVVVVVVIGVLYTPKPSYYANRGHDESYAKVSSSRSLKVEHVTTGSYQYDQF